VLGLCSVAGEAGADPAEQKDPPSVALGLTWKKAEYELIRRGKLRIPPEKDLLHRFARRIGGIPWDQWVKEGIVDMHTYAGGIRNMFRPALDKVVKGGGKIHFNLDHLDLRQHPSKHTMWELRQVCSTPAWLKSAVFYRRGRPLSSASKERVVRAVRNSLSNQQPRRR